VYAVKGRKMMYSNKLVASLKANGKILREFKDTVYIPFGSEYSFLLKNLHTTRAVVNIFIDGTDIVEGGLVLDPGREVDLERYVKSGNLSAGNKFKFIERTAAIEDGPRGVKLEDGLVRIEFQYEKPYVPPVSRGWITASGSTFGSTISTSYNVNGAMRGVDFSQNGQIMAQAASASVDKYCADNGIGNTSELHDGSATMDWCDVGITVPGTISPFGVWRNKKNDPNGSDTRAGVANYDDLYADILKWQNEKWIDYVTPQLYWYIGKEVADYAILAKWWAEHSYGCNIYSGQALYLIDPASKDQSWRTSEEITKQLAVNRGYPEIKGSMYFSAKFLKKNPLGLQENLLKEYYKYPALTPENPFVSKVLPEIPTEANETREGKDVVLSWKKAEKNSLFVVYRFKKLQRTNINHPDKILTVTSYTKLLLNAVKGYKPSRYRYVVTALSPSHTESAPLKFKKN